MPPKKALEHASSYTVGWIAALAHERAAALVLLDERHDKPKDFSKNESDQNSYSWGRIGAHNIVIASLPAGEYGLVSAADTASGLRASLPHIRIGLLVGIGAGIAGEHIGPDGQMAIKKEVLLGDIVVGIPDGTNGGVVQYDLYKAKGEAGGLERKGFLNAAPRALRSAVAALRAEHEIEESQVETYLEVFKSNPKTKTQYVYPSSAKDRIREHLQIKVGEEVRTEAMIHYGTIISGNTLVKSTADRDAILAWLKQDNIDPLCFEMEAAGVMNSFPCIVIRGICDYADEHKNDEWQRYAAATAAAYAKELLTYVDPGEVNKERALGEVLNEIHLDVQHVKNDTTELRGIITSTERKEILSWVCPVDYAQVYDTYVKACVQYTGQWLLEHQAFRHWLFDGQVLYCPGSPGVGKTMLATRILEFLYTIIPTSGEVVVAYVYFDHARQGEQDLVHLLSCLLRQLGHAAERTPQCVLDLYKKHHKQNTRPSDIELVKALCKIVRDDFAQVYVVLDALDECEPKTRFALVTLLRGMAQAGHVRLLATSRLIPEIDDLFCEDIRLRLDADGQDISAYVSGRTAELQDRLLFSDEVFQQIVATIVPAVHGMFLLARLHMDTLQSKTCTRDISDALKILPDGYNDAYKAAMNRINNQDVGHRALAKQVLMWVAGAKRPLLVSELQHALAIRSGDRELRSDGLTRVELLVAVCAGLVALRDTSLEAGHGVKTGMIVHLAHYTTQEYFDRAQDEWFPKLELALTKTCLSYLTLQALEIGPCDTDATLEVRLERYPFLEYAAKFWGLHATAVELTGENGDWTALQAAVTPFLHSSTLCDAAVQVLTLTGLSTIGYAAPSPRQSTACHLFARFQLRRLCDYCHDFGIDVSARDSKSQPPIYYAMEAHPEESAATFLSWSRQTNLHQYGDRALWYAVRYQQHEIVAQLVLSDHIDPNARDRGKTPLIWSAGLGHVRTIQALLACKRVDVNAVDDKSQTALGSASLKGQVDAAMLLLDVDGICTDGALLQAAKSGSTALVRHFIDVLRAPINAIDFQSRTALSHAAEHGNDEVLDLLLTESGLDVDLADADGNPPLFWAIHAGHIATAQRLIAIGRADVEFAVKQRWTAHFTSRLPLFLKFASERGYDDLVKVMPTAEEIMMMCNDDWPSMHPLWYACRDGHLPAVKFFAGKCQGTMRRVDDDGITPWLVAARHGQTAILEYLLRSEPSLLNSTDLSGRTALFHAARNGRIEVLKFLLGFTGVNINATDTNGETALIAAADYGRDDSIGILLKEDEINVNVRDAQGRTAFWHACRYSDLFTAQLLAQDERVDVFLSDYEGQTPLMAAVEQDEKVIVDFLLDNGTINVNEQDQTGVTALSYACRYSGLRMVAMLCRHDTIDVNISNHKGSSSLMEAIIANEEDVVVSLLQTPGIDVHARDENGKNALLYACEEGHLNLTLLLAERNPSGLSAYDTDGHLALSKLLERQDLLDDVLVEQFITLLNTLGYRDLATYCDGLGSSQVQLVLDFWTSRANCNWCSIALSNGWCCVEHQQIYCHDCVASGEWCDGGEGYECDLLEVKANWYAEFPRFTGRSKDFDIRVRKKVEYWRGVITCDLCHCDASRGYHCQTCLEDHFDICPNCVFQIEGCYSPEHKLQQNSSGTSRKRHRPWCVQSPVEDVPFAAPSVKERFADGEGCCICGQDIERGYWCHRCLETWAICPKCVNDGSWCDDRNHLLQDYSDPYETAISFPWRSYKELNSPRRKSFSGMSAMQKDVERRQRRSSVSDGDRCSYDTSWLRRSRRGERQE